MAVSRPTELLEAVRGLDSSVKQLAHRLRLVTIGAVITFALVIVNGVLFYQVLITQHDQQRTRREVLCPLYGVFLASYNPDSAAAQADPQRYEQAFTVIRRGVVVLGCPKS
jgi:hypothetical protein